MSLSIESVMADLAPMMGRQKKCRCARCGDTDPENFGVYKSRCLSCRRDDDTERRMRARQPRDFQQALETLRVINSFPPTPKATGASHDRR